MTVESIPHYNSRTTIRREIQRILVQLFRLQHGRGRRISRRKVVNHALSLESILYRRAQTMEAYSDLSTLETRLILAEDAIIMNRNIRIAEYNRMLAARQALLAQRRLIERPVVARAPRRLSV
mmetsp:Transcript_23242/g.48264  ORF Transcript_23242/g.48264 Transcript_23242/m.48264 type:complete len:123 (-) Transcript_23242:272-640(-)